MDMVAHYSGNGMCVKSMPASFRKLKCGSGNDLGQIQANSAPGPTPRIAYA